METETNQGWEIRELVLPTATDEEGFSAVAAACGVVLNRVTAPDSPERWEFVNNQVYWNLSRLASGEVSWPRPGAALDTSQVCEALVLNLSPEAAQVFRRSIDLVYDDHDVPPGERRVYDTTFELFVSGTLAKTGFIHVLDEKTGEERLPPGIAQLLAQSGSMS